MMGYGFGPAWGMGSWIGMGVGMLVFWGLVVFAVIALVRWSSGERPGWPRRSNGASSSPTGREILDQRFARGEIDEAEYRARRAALEGR